MSFIKRSSQRDNNRATYGGSTREGEWKGKRGKRDIVRMINVICTERRNVQAADTFSRPFLPLCFFFSNFSLIVISF